MNTIFCELDNAYLRTNLNSEELARKVDNAVQWGLSSRLVASLQSTEHEPYRTDSAHLPAINEPVFEFLQQRKSDGSKLILLTAHNKEKVKTLLGESNIFDKIEHKLDTGNTTNENGDFGYVGTPETSALIWRQASTRYLVARSNSSTDDIEKDGITVNGLFKTTKPLLRATLESLRPHQWLKNMLVFVPIVTSQQLSDQQALINSIIMFICFSLVASFGYLVNDVLDLQSDRAHSTKRNRPLARGDLSIQHSTVVGLILLVLTALGCQFLSTYAVAALGCYLILTIAYSIFLKTKLMIDVVALGALFSLRVIGGAEAINSEISFYLMSFSIFLFASLGMVKRYTELLNLQKNNRLTARGRGYQVEDMAPVRIIGISMGYMSVFILGQYINSPVVTNYYSNPKLIWLLFPLLMFWLGRLWILANRGEVSEDPLIFTIKDRTSQLVFVIAAAVLYFAD